MLPIIIFLMMAMFEFAHFFYEYKVIVNQVRNGARVFSAHVANEEPGDEIRNLFVTGRPDCDGCERLFPGLDRDSVFVQSSIDEENRISLVEFRYNEFEYTPVFDMFSVFFAGKKLTVSSIMRQTY